jgi:glycosyltransferase involved in cell wall biosynthesis
VPRKIVVVIYPFFYPGFKAGGPVQSLTNMITLLGNEYDFRVITSGFDMQDKLPYSNVILDGWNTVALPGLQSPINVYYHSQIKINAGVFKSIVSDLRVDAMFINGLFTSWSTIPLWMIRRKQINANSGIISVRGMLQQGALKSNFLMKKVFLLTLRNFGLVKNVIWHATNEEESEDVFRVINKNARVIVAENIPRHPFSSIHYLPKTAGQIRLVYLSLIAAKKNLLLVIQALAKVQASVVLDIFGPVKDPIYWDLCQQEIKLLPSHVKVQYMGEVNPRCVQDTLAKYHALILLTKGENFGHALYESLSVGRPLITSQYTPWKNLQDKHAGWNIDIEQEEKISLVLQQIAQIDDQTWNSYCDGAWRIANHYYFESDFVEQYKKLFSARA